MKKLAPFMLILLAGCALLVQSCSKDDCMAEVTYVKRTPVWLSMEEVRDVAVEVLPARELEEPGKIYFYNNLLLINELRDGIHLIDNTDPYNPQNIGFLQIAGNVDMAIRNDVLYADSYADLLSIDISNVLNAQLLHRLEGAYQNYNFDGLDNDRILAYYEEELVTEEQPCGQNFFFNNVDIFPTAGFGPLAESFSADGGSFSGVSTSGLGGSMARFTIKGNFLYIVDDHELGAFDLAIAAEPILQSRTSLGWGIETIFPYQEYLFIGSNTGMFIYSTNTPSNPSYVSDFVHANACDPVFVKDNYAYVTLRTENICTGTTNQLDLIDISNITNPTLARTFPMENPHGLSIAENNLFLCEGASGIKVFDIEEPTTLDQRLLEHFREMDAFDVIALPNNVLMVIGEDGFIQFDYSDPSNLKEMSRIEVQG